MRNKEIKNLIKFVAKAGAREVSIETEKLKLTIKAGEKTVIQQAPVVELPAISEPKQSAPPPLAKEQDAASEEESKYLTIKAPIIGTFYRKPSPDKPAFVEIGDSVSEGSVLCVTSIGRIVPSTRTVLLSFVLDVRFQCQYQLL